MYKDEDLFMIHVLLDLDYLTFYLLSYNYIWPYIITL